MLFIPHEIHFTIPYRYKISLFVFNHNVTSLVSNLQTNASLSLPVLNLTQKEFSRLFALPTSFLKNRFQVSIHTNQLFYLPGLQGGGCGHSKTKKNTDIVLFEGSITQISNFQQRGDYTHNEVMHAVSPRYIDPENSICEHTYTCSEPEKCQDNIENHLNEASSDRLLGIYYREVGKLKEAKIKFLDCFCVRNHFCTPGDIELTDVLLDLAEIYFQEGVDFKESLKYYTLCLENCQKNFEENMEFVEKVNMGLLKVYAKLKDGGRVLDCSEGFESIVKSYTVENLAEEYFKIGEDLFEADLKASEQYFMKVFNMLWSLTGFSKKKELFKYLGNIYYDTKVYKNSKEFYERFLELALKDEHPDKSELIFVYNRIGKSYKRLGDNKNATKMNEISLKLTCELDEITEEVAKTWVQLGILQIKENEIDKAINSFKKSIEIRLRLGKTRADCILAYKNLASVLFNIKNFAEAKDYFLVLLDIYKEDSQNEDGIPSCLINTATCCSELEQFYEAEKYFSYFFDKEAWVNTRKEVEYDMAAYAWVLFKIGKFIESGELYEKGIEIMLGKLEPDRSFLKMCYSYAEESFDKAKDHKKALDYALKNMKIMMKYFQSEKTKIENLKQNIAFYQNKLKPSS